MLKLDKKRLIGKGCNSNCYLLDDGNIYKEYIYPLDISDIERFKLLLKYDNESFAFPFEFNYDEKNFYGYITRRASGKTLYNCFKKSNIVDMSTHSILLERNIDYLSSGKFIMCDFHSENILYDGSKFTVIDMDDYFRTNKYTYEEIKERNIGFYKTLISGLFIENLINDKYKSLIIDKISCKRYLKISASEFIISVKEMLDNFYKEDIKTMDDINKITGR